MEDRYGHDRLHANVLSNIELEMPRKRTWQENLVNAVIASVVISFVCWLVFGG